MIRRFALGLFLLASTVPFAVFADSTLWTTNVSNVFYACVPATNPPGVAQYLGWGWGYNCSAVLQNPDISVAYNAEAVDPNTGADLCNATIPVGNQVELQFEPHVPSDVSWFGTGFDMDSPYGNWSADAAAPSVASPGQWCQQQNYLNTWGYAGNNSYVLLQVAPPGESIEGTDGLTCGAPNAQGDELCTASTPGIYTPTFDFASTNGRFFYAAQYSSYWWGYYPWLAPLNGCIVYPDQLATAAPTDPQGGVFGTMTANASQPYTLQVPEQQISCPITVTSATGTPPTAPDVSAGGVAVTGATACTVGEPYSITFSSTDPQGQQIRYGIDWDDSGTIEEYVPSSGFVNSGTTETASRTFAVQGEKKIRVIAIDQSGFASSWTTFTTSCSGESTTDASIIEAGGTDVGDTGSGGSADTSPALEISATPTIVKPGETTNVSWSASNVTSSSCLVTGSNGDGGSGVQGWIGAVSTGIVSSPINQQTVYTLSCIGLDGSPLTQSTTVNIIPVFEEI